MPVGVTLITTVAVEPDCNEGIGQLMVPFDETVPQDCEEELADTNVTGTPVTDELKLSVTTMLFARSGPLLVIV